MSSHPWITLCIVIVIVASLKECATKRNSEMAEILHRPIRSLTFPDNTVLALFLALSVPLGNVKHVISVSHFFEAEYNLPTNFSDDPLYSGKRNRRGIDRGIVYQVLESKFERAGYPGRECLLRSICETSEWPIRHNGILGDMMHVILTPSSSRSEDLPEEYAEAERTGRDGTCSKSYSLCPMGIFDIIGTLIGV